MKKKTSEWQRIRPLFISTIASLSAGFVSGSYQLYGSSSARDMFRSQIRKYRWLDHSDRDELKRKILSILEKEEPQELAEIIKSL